MAGATIAASLPSIQRAFTDTPHVELLTRLAITMPALAIALLSPVSGWFVDRFGRTRFLYIGMVLYGIAGVAGGLVNDLYLLLAFRLLLGVAVSMSMTSVLTLIGDYFEGAERSSFLGLQAAFMGFGGVLFITAGGWLADISWRGPFFLYGAAFLFLPLTMWALHEPTQAEREHRPAPGHQAVADAPDSLNKPLAIFNYAVLVLMFVVMYAIPTQVPFIVEKKFAVSSTWVGLVVAALPLSSAFSSLMYPNVKRRNSYLGVYGIVFFFAGIGYLSFSYAPSPIFAMISLLIVGLGMGMLMPNGSVWLMDISPMNMRGRVMGGMTTSVFLGQFISPFVTQPVISGLGPDRAFQVLGAALIVAVGLTLLSTALFRRWS